LYDTEIGEEVPRYFLRQDLLKVDAKRLVKELEPGENVVDRVIGKKVVNGKTLYRVTWIGYPDETHWLEADKSYSGAIKAYEAGVAKKNVAAK